MGGVFISYRRSDTAGHAMALHSELEKRLGSDCVFMDVDDIDIGQNFTKALEQALAETTVLLALIGRHWLAAHDNETGKRRIDEPEDFVRREIATALDAGLIVIPLLFDDARMPSAEQLPESLRPLASLNAASLRHARYKDDIDNLLDKIPNLNLATTQTEASVAPPDAQATIRAAWIGAGATLLAAIIGFGVYVLNSESVPSSAFDPTPFLDVSINGPPYKIENTSQGYRFFPDTPYLRAVLEGAGILGVGTTGRYAVPFDYDFPSLDVKVVNNTGRTIYLTQALVEVTESKLDNRPLIEIWDNNWCRPATVFFINQGWGTAVNASVSFNVVAHNAPAFNNTSEERLLTNSTAIDKLFDEPFAITKNLGDIEDRALLNFLDDLAIYGVRVRMIRNLYDPARDNRDQFQGNLARRFLGSLWGQTPGRDGWGDDGTVWMYGIFEYSDEETSERKSFRLTRSSRIIWDGCGSMGEISAEYNGIELEVEGSKYERIIPLSQYVEHGDTDRFTIRVSARKSSAHKFRVRVKYGEGKYLQSPLIQLDLLAPRGFILGGDPREEGAP